MKYQKKVISCDVDGVLSSFESGFTKLVRKRYPEKNVPDDYSPKDWGYSDILTQEEQGPLWDDLREVPGFWTRLKSYPQNTAAMALFLQECWQKFDVYYITSRLDTKGSSALEQTREWLKSHGLFTPSTSILVVRDPKEKLSLQKAIGSVASIDDYYPTVAAATALLPDHQPWLLSRPWNEEYQAQMHSGIKLATSLQDYLNWLLRTFGC